MITSDRMSQPFGGCDRRGQQVEALHSPEDHLARMRQCLIQAKWAEQIGDDEGALAHELAASIALNAALSQLRK